MISIIVPVYNVEKYLSKCIESIISQTYTDWELILIDDGSKDKSGDICDSYSLKDERIKTIHKSNGGVSSARNKGLELAKGEYVTFIDSDDWVDSCYLADFYVDENNLFDIYISGAAYDVDGSVYAKKVYSKREINTYQEAKEQFFKQKIWDNGYPWGKLYRRSIIDENNLRFDVRLQIHEDHLFVVSFLGKVEKIAIVDSALYHYLVFDDSGRKLSSKKNHPEMYRNVSNAFKKVISNLCEKWLMSNEQMAFLERKFVLNMHLKAFESSLILNMKEEYVLEADCLALFDVSNLSSKFKLYRFLINSFLSSSMSFNVCRLIHRISSYRYKLIKRRVILNSIVRSCV